MQSIEPEGFIDYGSLSIDDNITHWSSYNRPVIARASYYYITYIDLGINVVQTQKSERIENYAIRLKETIDYIAEKTGKQKVSIVGYSMGGLVARTYIDLFGESRVDKLITLATPNHGITKRIVNACKVTGADRECEDMAMGSALMRRLQGQEIRGTDVYTIGARGCDMDGEMGDGIVPYDSTRLEGATHYAIEGDCRLGSPLHNRILDPSQYPETKDILLEIFKR